MAFPEKSHKSPGDILGEEISHAKFLDLSSGSVDEHWFSIRIPIFLNIENQYAPLRAPHPLLDTFPSISSSLWPLVIMKDRLRPEEEEDGKKEEAPERATS